MIRYISVGVLLLLLFCVVMAPASLLRHATENVPGLDLIGTTGTVWSGRGGVVVQGEQVGQAEWTFQPLRLFSLELAWKVAFSGRDAELTGEIGVSTGSLRGNASGVLGENALNYSLEPWGVRVERSVAVESLSALWEDQALTNLDGRLTWPGGTVSWFMDGDGASATLPAMTGQLGHAEGSLTGLLLPDQNQTPVVQVNLAPDGTLTVKISKLLTRLLGKPWPGSEPDHAIVIEMVDKVF